MVMAALTISTAIETMLRTHLTMPPPRYYLAIATVAGLAVAAAEIEDAGVVSEVEGEEAEAASADVPLTRKKRTEKTSSDALGG